MDLLFPEVERVIYNRNPLDNVVCQLRFPVVLKIDVEIPSDFQERVRCEYPNLSESSELVFQTSPNIEEQLPSESVQQILKSPGIKNYEFSSEDGIWKINLTRNFMSLSTRNYHKWEEFKEELQLPLNALIDVYSPMHFTRVGLRYIDVIVRSRLGLEGVDWGKLINGYVLGMMAAPGKEDKIRSAVSTYEIGLEEGKDIVRIASRIVKPIGSDEKCYMIDSDFFTHSKTEINEVINKLDSFNKHASRLIRWCIKERLHEAMEPQKP